MPLPILHWTDYALAAIAARGITEAEVEEVFGDDYYGRVETSDASDRPLIRGYTLAGRYLVVVFEVMDDNPDRFEIVNAFAPEET